MEWGYFGWFIMVSSYTNDGSGTPILKIMVANEHNSWKGKRYLNVTSAISYTQQGVYNEFINKLSHLGLASSN